MPHSAQPLTRRRATTAAVIWQEVRAYSPTPWDYLVHPGIRFGRAVMSFVEVAGVSTGSPFPLAHRLTLTHATPSPVSSRSCASIGEVPLGLVHLGSHVGGVVMRFVEVAGVSTRLTAFFSTCASQCTASQLQACHYGCRDLAGGARLLSNSPGTIYCTREPVSCPRSDVFRGSGRRCQYKAQPFTALHSLSLSRMPLRRPCFPGVARLLPRFPCV